MSKSVTNQSIVNLTITDLNLIGITASSINSTNNNLVFINSSAINSSNASIDNLELDNLIIDDIDLNTLNASNINSSNASIDNLELDNLILNNINSSIINTSILNASNINTSLINNININDLNNQVNTNTSNIDVNTSSIDNINTILTNYNASFNSSEINTSEINISGIINFSNSSTNIIFGIDELYRISTTDGYGNMNILNNIDSQNQYVETDRHSTKLLSITTDTIAKLGFLVCSKGVQGNAVSYITSAYLDQYGKFNLDNSPNSTGVGTNTIYLNGVNGEIYGNNLLIDNDVNCNNLNASTINASFINNININDLNNQVNTNTSNINTNTSNIDNINTILTNYNTSFNSSEINTSGINIAGILNFSNNNTNILFGTDELYRISTTDGYGNLNILNNIDNQNQYVETNKYAVKFTNKTTSGIGLIGFMVSDTGTGVAGDNVDYLTSAYLNQNGKFNIDNIPNSTTGIGTNKIYLDGTTGEIYGNDLLIDNDVNCNTINTSLLNASNINTSLINNININDLDNQVNTNTSNIDINTSSIDNINTTLTNYNTSFNSSEINTSLLNASNINTSLINNININDLDNQVNTNTSNIDINTSSIDNINTTLTNYNTSFNSSEINASTIYCDDIRSTTDQTINSFTIFVISSEVTYSNNEFGRGAHIKKQTGNQLYYYSNSRQFSYDSTNEGFKLNGVSKSGYYEIEATINIQNTTNSRKVYMIGMAKNDDLNIGSPISPRINESPEGASPYFSTYIRMSEGKVSTLRCKRRFYVNNTTDIFSINTYCMNSGGDEMNEVSNFILYSANIQFTYLSNITGLTSGTYS